MEKDTNDGESREKPEGDKSLLDDSPLCSRRNIMKIAAGSGVSAVASTGLASAETGPKQVESNNSGEDLVEIEPDDEIGRTGKVVVTEGVSGESGTETGTISPASHGECQSIGDTWTIPVVGVDVGIEITFCPECDVSLEITVLGQSTKDSVKVCGDELEKCEESTLRGGVFKISLEECYYYDEELNQTRVEMSGEICGVSLRHGWVCDNVHRTYYEP